MTTLNRLEQIIELTGNICNAFTIALYKADLNKKKLTLRHHISLSSNFNAEIKINFGEDPIGIAAITKKPFIEEHFEKKSIKLCQYNKEENLKSFLAMPVIHKKLEGVLVIDSKENYNFPVKQQKVIASLANQMAWELNHEKKEAQSSTPNNFMFRDLISYSRFIAESTDKNKIIERLTNIPESVLACDGHALIWFNSDKIGKILKCKGFNQDVTGIPIHLGKGLVGSCAKNARPILFSNTGGRSVVIFSAEENKEKTFSQLVGASLRKTTSQLFLKTTGTI